MRSSFDSRDASRSTTSQLLFALLFGNLFAILCVTAFLPFPSTGILDQEFSSMLAIGVMSLVSTGLLFLASAMRREAMPWWIVAMALNVTQLGRLVAAVALLVEWGDFGEWAGVFWTFVFVPYLGVLSAVGLVVTLREARKSRRRRLARAA